jgi:hypothetical protein
MLVLTQSTYTLFNIILRLQNLNTKNVLMLVVLSTGILTALAATAMSQAQPVFAETDDCEDNDDKNCNEKKIEQTNDCENGDIIQGDGELPLATNNGIVDCSNFAANPDDVEEQAQVGQDQTLEPHDQVFGQLP